MSSLPYNKPICWELFRNEPLEVQNRRAAIKKSHADADRERKPDSGLWWDAQKHVDQVVPAEFVCPSEIDTKTYRYQVFARPPPIQCQPKSLNEATDCAPPLRYNVKRVAVDKPFPPASFECSAHWSQHPFVLQKNNVQGGGQDCSRNNNTNRTTPRLSYLLSNEHQSPVSNSENEEAVLANGRPGFSGELTPNKASYETLGLGLSEPYHQGGVHAHGGGLPPYESRYENKASAQMYNNNSRKCVAKPVKSESYQNNRNVEGITVSKNNTLNDQRIKVQSKGDNITLDAQNNQRSDIVTGGSYTPRFSRSRSSVHGCHGVNASRAALSGTRENNTAHVNLPYETSSTKHGGCYSPRPSSSRSCQLGPRDNYVNLTRPEARNDNHWCGNQCESTANATIREAGNMRIAQATSPRSEASFQRYRVNLSPSNTSVSSRAESACSVSTLGSRRGAAVKKSLASDCTPLSQQSLLAGTARFNGGSQVRLARASSSRSRDSVASLLSHSDRLSLSSPSSSASMRRRKFVPEQRSSNCRDSVASLLNSCDSNKNNAYGRIGVSEAHALQDTFVELILPVITHSCILLNTSGYGCICRDHQSDTLIRTERMDDNKHFFIPQDTEKLSSHSVCTNNNASTAHGGKAGRYILQCRPIHPYETKGQHVYGEEEPKLLCKFHKKRPNVAPGEPILLDEVRPTNPVTWRVKKDEKPQQFRCLPVTSCATGKPVEGSTGPLMLCEPTRPKTPEIGYGTYKIVGSLQRREEPPPNTRTDLRLPPDVEEYQEFTRRCPNYRTGRYDRSDPLNEMPLPSHKATVLLRASDANPFLYCKMPKRTVAPLFQPVKTSSDLSWSLPTFPARQ